MTLVRFARMCEALEQANGSNRKIEILRESLRAFSNPELVLRILSDELEPNNIGKDRVLTWLAQMFEVFEDEIQSQIDTWGDIGEGMLEFLCGRKEMDGQLSIFSLFRLLNIDCSSIQNNSFTLIKDELTNCSALEVKWFIRYWIRTPRNGVSHSTVIKMLNKEYPDKEVNRYANYATIEELYNWCENDVPISMTNMIGRFIKPMLAKTFKDNLPDEYVIDLKYDGNRYQIHHSPDTTMIFNRAGKLVTEQYPDVVSILEDCEDTFIVDAEIYPVNHDGSPAEHKKLGTRVHSKDKAQAVADCPVKLAVFDMMYDGFESLLDMPYRTRLEQLEKFVVLRPHNAMLLSPDIVTSYNYAINEGYEGIMIKDLNAPYESKRSKALLKHKPPLIELDVVITSAKYGDGKRSNVFGTFGISVRDDNGDYVRIGSIGTGFSDDDLSLLTTRLKQLTEKYEKDEWFFLPRIVLEVNADLVSQDSDGNYGLRFPRVKRIRDDKYAADVNTIDDVIALS